MREFDLIFPLPLPLPLLSSLFSPNDIYASMRRIHRRDRRLESSQAHKTSGSVLLDNMATIASSSRKSMEASNELPRGCASWKRYRESRLVSCTQNAQNTEHTPHLLHTHLVHRFATLSFWPRGATEIRACQWATLLAGRSAFTAACGCAATATACAAANATQKVPPALTSCIM